MDDTAQKIADLRRRFARSITPPDDLTVDQWADRYRILPRSSSAEGGPWRTDRFPFLREIMVDLSPSSWTEEIWIMKGAQLGFTEAALNYIFYSIDHSPAPMMYVQPTIDAVKEFAEQRFVSSMEECPTVKGKIVSESKSKTRNRILLKRFPGGILFLAGANSAPTLRSKPIERLIFDEPEGYPADLAGEGSPIELGIARLRNFPHRKILGLSTPGIRETSVIEPRFQQGDQRYYLVPCPHCMKLQRIDWPKIKYDLVEDNPLEPFNVRLVCEFCREEIYEHHKTWMLEHGKWVPLFTGRRIHSYFISSLYSPLGFYSWERAAQEWCRATHLRDRNLLKVFINTVLGETWTESNKTPETIGLTARREHYAAPVPAGVLVLTCGVDVQEDRIEAEVLGFGKGEESWSIEYVVFRGNIAEGFVWEQLDAFLKRSWIHESGIEMNIAAVGIDSGFQAKAVYGFCKAREYRRCYPVKGFPGFGKGFINRPKNRNDEGVYLVHAYVDEIKSTVNQRLLIDKPGPGYCHFPDRAEYDPEYFRMLTAEKLLPSRSGVRRLRWELPAGRRNEALDARCYAIAIRQFLNPDLDRLEKPLACRIGAPAAGKPGQRVRVVSRGVE